jgi:PhzF family phenazine biosynthesis protein
MKYYIVDAFADALFKGNQAGVCLLNGQEWLSDEVLQNIAAENNLAETAFIIKRPDFYDLRWFTPDMEVDLCGHATLASAFVLMNFIDEQAQEIRFETQSGTLIVAKTGEYLTLDFPARMPVQTEIHPLIEKAIGCEVCEAYINRDTYVLVDSPEKVRNLQVNMAVLNSIPNLYGLVIMAKGNEEDFVSRYFTPNSSNTPEDPVCGSAHCVMTPFWAERLGKNKLVARQLSARGGMLLCELRDDRVLLSGKSKLYLAGEIYI